MARTARVLSRLFLHFTHDHRGDPSCGETLHKWQPLPSSWTSRFPDPEGRESATPFPCWLCVHLCISRWVRPPRVLESSRGPLMAVAGGDNPRVEILRDASPTGLCSIPEENRGSLLTRTCRQFLRVKKSRFERKNRVPLPVKSSETIDSKGAYESIAVAVNVHRPNS